MPLNFIRRLAIDPALAPARIALTLLFALAAAVLCLKLHTPLPWMIGPLLVTAVLSMLGAPTESWTPFRNAGQWAIGAALGLYFTPQVMALVASLWWAIALNIVWALALGLMAGAWLHRVHHGPGPLQVVGLTRVTSYFAAPVGGASEMTLMAERHGGQTELVASAHSLRLLLVTVIVPFGFQWAGLHGLDSTVPGARMVDWPGLALLALLTGAGCWLMLKLKRTNPWFIGALAASLVVTACGFTLSAIPQAMSNGAQLLIGISLGVRFSRSFVHMAPRWLASVALTTLVLIAACAGFAWLLAQLMPVHWATVLLGTAPGGIAEMSITAKVLQLGVPLVTAFHVTRLTVVLLITEPVYRWLYRPE
ncbi:MAG: AbrB family transcriptional regulator [Pseudomonadota bacterium]